VVAPGFVIVGGFTTAKRKARGEEVIAWRVDPRSGAWTQTDRLGGLVCHRISSAPAPPLRSWCRPAGGRSWCPIAATTPSPGSLSTTTPHGSSRSAGRRARAAIPARSVGADPVVANEQGDNVVAFDCNAETSALVKLDRTVVPSPTTIALV
jgi:hypothetical protein